jgi:hypothetical protein
MGLRSLRLPTETVEVPGSDSFAVRGLSLQDVTVLVRKHGPILTMLFEKFKTQTGDLSPETVAALGTSLLETAPEVASEIIALAEGSAEAEDVEGAARLPFPVQVDALEKIATLTFTSEAAIKKVVETVIRAATGVTSLTTSLKS